MKLFKNIVFAMAARAYKATHIFDDSSNWNGEFVKHIQTS